MSFTVLCCIVLFCDVVLIEMLFSDVLSPSDSSDDPDDHSDSECIHRQDQESDIESDDSQHEHSVSEPNLQSPAAGGASSAFSSPAWSKPLAWRVNEYATDLDSEDRQVHRFGDPLLEMMYRAPQFTERQLISGGKKGDGTSLSLGTLGDKKSSARVGTSGLQHFPKALYNYLCKFPGLFGEWSSTPSVAKEDIKKMMKKVVLGDKVKYFGGLKLWNDRLNVTQVLRCFPMKSGSQKKTFYGGNPQARIQCHCACSSVLFLAFVLHFCLVFCSFVLFLAFVFNFCTVLCSFVLLCLIIYCAGYCRLHSYCNS